MLLSSLHYTATLIFHIMYNSVLVCSRLRCSWALCISIDVRSRLELLQSSLPAPLSACAAVFCLSHKCTDCQADSHVREIFSENNWRRVGLLSSLHCTVTLIIKTIYNSVLVCIRLRCSWALCNMSHVRKDTNYLPAKHCLTTDMHYQRYISIKSILCTYT